jgi:uncharacterized oxidoreductase
MKLTGNTILITGGGTGIGLAMAGAFLERGNRVAICGRRQEKLDEACRVQPELRAYRCDVSDAAQRKGLLEAVLADGFAPNVLINNAAIMRTYDLSGLQALDLQRVEGDVKTNLLAPVALIDLFLPLLLEQVAPVIMNVSSPGGVVPIANVPVYCASKAALDSYTRSLRYQLEGRVEVIDMYPPSVETAMMDKVEIRKVGPEVFVRDLIKGLEKGGDEIWVGEGKYLNWIHRISRRLAFHIANSATKVDRSARP